MTAPLPPKPPRDWENITTREAFSYVRTGEDGGPAPPPGRVRDDILGPFHFVTEAGGLYVIGTHPAAATWLDDTGHFTVPSESVAKIIAWAHVVVSGVADSYLDVEYSVNAGTTWASTGIVIPLNSIGPKVVTAPLPSPANTATTRYRGIAVGGDDDASPELYNFAFALHSMDPAIGDDPDPPDVPTGSPWGNVVFDINAAGEQFTALGYGDGDDVSEWPDETAFANDMATEAELLLPKYRATGFDGTRPCVEWDGGNVPLVTDDNPTEAYGSYTYYFVIAGLDGGDSARIWGAGLGDSFGYSYEANANSVAAGNNTVFTGLNAFAADSGGSAWGMSGAHIYRFTKHAGSSSHQIWVNGVLKDDADGAPQTNNGGQAQLMNYLTGLGLSARVARVVAYDQAHMSPMNTGTMANGKTLPELLLSATWGTP